MSNLEDVKDVRFWIFTLICLLLGGCCVIGAIVYYNLQVTQMYVQNGYEQDTIQGSSGVYWVKKHKDGTVEVAK